MAITTKSGARDAEALMRKLEQRMRGLYNIIDLNDFLQYDIPDWALRSLAKGKYASQLEELSWELDKYDHMAKVSTGPKKRLARELANAYKKASNELFKYSVSSDTELRRVMKSLTSFMDRIQEFTRVRYKELF